SGTEPGLRTALALARDEGTVLELSWFGDQAVSLPLGAAFHSRRLTLRSSQVGRVAPAMRARFDHNARLALALNLLHDPALDVLISGESPFDDLPATLQRIASPGNHELCHRIRYH
ncbi:MAG TPA: hypothetical protein VHM19_13400, partial [Polyangiales bacterium]|nr:hypothetical protein [Polyangiales bacterium]